MTYGLERTAMQHCMPLLFVLGLAGCSTPVAPTTEPYEVIVIMSPG